jgi:hypothetical protein
MLFDTRVPKDYAELKQDLFFVSVDFVGAQELAAAGAVNAARTLPVTVDSDAHLLLVGASHVTTDTTQLVDQALPFSLVTLKVGSSGRDLMESAQHIRNIAGTAQRPCIWPRPKFLAANSKFKVTVQNLEAAIRAVRLTFYAFKIFT